MSDLTTTLDVSELEAFVRHLPRRMERHFRKGMQRSGAEWQSAMRLRLSGVGVGRGSDGRFQRAVVKRSGRLQRSMRYKVEGNTFDDLTVTMFTEGVPAGQVRTLEHGHPGIKPKSGRYLAIPGPANRTRSGATREDSARDWFEKYQGRYYVIPSKRTKGNLLVMLRPGEAPFRNRLAWVLTPGPIVIPGPKSTGSPSLLGFHDTWKRFEEARRKRFHGLLEKSVAEAVQIAKTRVGKL